MNNVSVSQFWTKTGREFQTDGAAVLKERLPKEVRLNGTCSSGADDDRRIVFAQMCIMLYYWANKMMMTMMMMMMEVGAHAWMYRFVTCGNGGGTLPHCLSKGTSPKCLSNSSNPRSFCFVRNFYTHELVHITRSQKSRVQTRKHHFSGRVLAPWNDLKLLNYYLNYYAPLPLFSRR